MTEAVCRNCGFSDSGRYCSHCGLDLAEGPAGLQTVRPLLGPLYEYFSYAKEIIDPEKMISEIKAKRFHSTKLLSFIVSAVAISTLFEYIFPSEALLPVNAPIIAEALVTILLIMISVVANFPLHFLLNRGNRGVGATEFMIATLGITALFYPWLTLLNGCLRCIGVENPENKTGLGTLYLYLQTYALLYGRSQGSVFGSMMIYFLGLIVIGVIGISAFG